MKKYVVPALLFIVSVTAGCAYFGGGQAAGASAESNPSMLAVVLQQQVQMKGPQMFCSQSTYRNCLGLAQAQCTSELNVVKERCYNAAMSNSTGGSNGGLFATHYASCMTLNHSLMHPERAAAITSCIEGANFDWLALLSATLY